MKRLLTGLVVASAVFLVMADIAKAHGPQAPQAPASQRSQTGAPNPAGNPAPAPQPTGLGGVTGGGAVPAGGTTGGGAAGPAGGGGAAPRGGATGGMRKSAGGAGRFPTRWGHGMRSPAVVKILDITWVEAEWPTAEHEGYAKSVLPLSTLIHEKCFNPNCVDLHCKDFKCRDENCMRDKKPAMVYLYDPMEKRETKSDRERDMFGSDDIAALTNFVHCFHMAADKVEAEQYAKNYGTKLPALIFIAPNRRTLGVLSGTNITQKQVVAQFDNMFDVCYGKKMSSVLKSYKDILARLEKAEDKIANAAPRVRDLDYRLRKSSNGRLKSLLAKANKKLAKATATYRAIADERAQLLSMKLVIGTSTTAKN